MRNDLALLMVLIMSLAAISALSSCVQPVKALYQVVEIDINADGSVTPSDAPVDNVNDTFYTLTDDVNVTGVTGPYNGVAVRIMRSNIVFNGNGHTITNGAGYDCFAVGYGPNNVTIANTTAIGFNICLYLEANNCTIKGNTFSSNGYTDNVRVRSAGDNYFEGNNITNSGGTCVNMYFWPGLNNTFVENYILNSNGVAITRSSGGGGAKFYHNVIGGGVDTFYTPDCTWDNGYPSGGNYWIGYVGIDKFSGPNQNITGSDGIGDTPLVLGPDEFDHYPFLMLDIFNVSQTPSTDSVLSTDVVAVNATVTHYFPLEQVILNCTYTNSTTTWTDSINMTNLEDDVWNGLIPALPVGTNVTYVIVAQDNSGSSVDSKSQGYTFEYPVIVPEFPAIAFLPILFVATLSAALLFRRNRLLRQTK